MPTEIAFFTPNEITGSAQWLDLWNADLWWGQSQVPRLAEINQAQFRWERTTYRDDIDVDQANGVIQAAFSMPDSGYFLGTVMLSSFPDNQPAPVSIQIDTTDAGTFYVTGTAMEIPVVANLSAGSHRLSIIQRERIYGWFPVRTNLWFHSITCFQV